MTLCLENRSLLVEVGFRRVAVHKSGVVAHACNLGTHKNLMEEDKGKFKARTDFTR